MTQAHVKSPEYEKGYEDGFSDGWQDAAVKVLPALRLALDRLELSDYDGDEEENMKVVQAAIDELVPFVGES